MLTLLATLTLLPSPAQAATFEAGDRMYIETAVSDDYYGAGELVSVLADIRGDFYAAGGQVMVDGKISQDSVIVAGDTSIKGEIADDLRVATGNMRMAATVKGDVLAGCGTLTIDSSSFIGGDLIAATGEAVIDGNIGGDLKIAGDPDGNLRINSVISGSVAILGFEHIDFGPNAKIIGNLWYRGKEALKIPEGVVEGEIIFKQVEKKEAQYSTPQLLAGFSLFKFLSLLFFGLFFIWLFRYFIINAVGRSYEATLKSLGIGFLVVILTPIAAFLFMITTIGIPLSFIILALWLIILYLGKVMAAMLIGYKIVKVDTGSRFGRLYGGFALGALVFTLIGMAPVIGWIINFLFVLIALGGMISHRVEIYDHLKKKKLC